MSRRCAPYCIAPHCNATSSYCFATLRNTTRLASAHRFTPYRNATFCHVTFHITTRRHAARLTTARCITSHHNATFSFITPLRNVPSRPSTQISATFRSAPQRNVSARLISVRRIVLLCFVPFCTVALHAVTQRNV
jgi:hypothetical protein